MDKPNDDDGVGDWDLEEEAKANLRESEINYAIAKVPAFPHVSVESAATDFGAANFLVHLNTFLQSESIVPHTNPSDTSTFPVYRQFSLSLPNVPEVTAKITKDTVHATKRISGKITRLGCRSDVHQRFSTVLVQERPADGKNGPLDGKESLLALYIVVN